MHFLSLISYLFAIASVVTSVEDMFANEEEVNKMATLCEKPYINSADRMVNNTVRLYRGNVYWNLNGLPANSGTLDGPYDIPFQNMAPIFRNNSVVTLLGGTDRGKTVKTDGKNYWLWDDKGVMKSETTGLMHNRFPVGGFEAAIHDGNPDNPTLIGFKGIKSYYFSTRYKVWTIDNKPSGWIKGKYNESFPTDLTAAFSYPADKPKDEYLVYFFKRDKFCKRTKILKSGKDCDQWLSNRVLFGCDNPNTTSNEKTSKGFNTTSKYNLTLLAPDRPKQSRVETFAITLTQSPIGPKVTDFDTTHTQPTASVLPGNGTVDTVSADTQSSHTDSVTESLSTSNGPQSSVEPVGTVSNAPIVDPTVTAKPNQGLVASNISFTVIIVSILVLIQFMLKLN